MAFSGSNLLMQRGIANDFPLGYREQRQVPAKIDVLTPIADHLRIGYAMFNKHSFRLGNREKEFVETLLIVFTKRPQASLGAILEFDFLWIFLQVKFERHRIS